MNLEWRQSAGFEFSAILLVGLEIENAVGHETKHQVIVEKAMTTEHVFRRHFTGQSQQLQQVRDEVGVGMRGRSFQFSGVESGTS